MSYRTVIQRQNEPPAAALVQPRFVCKFTNATTLPDQRRSIRHAPYPSGPGRPGRRPARDCGDRRRITQAPEGPASECVRSTPKAPSNRKLATCGGRSYPTMACSPRRSNFSCLIRLPNGSVPSHHAMRRALRCSSSEFPSVSPYVLVDGRRKRHGRISARRAHIGSLGFEPRHATRPALLRGAISYANVSLFWPVKLWKQGFFCELGC